MEAQVPMSQSVSSDNHSLILESNAGPIRYLTLNRPEKLNAINGALLQRFDEVMEAARNDDCKVVVIKGAGRAFSTGFDLTPGQHGPGKQHDIIDDREDINARIERWLRVWEFPKPVIAQVHGYCLAGASQLAAVCDLTVIAEDAVVGMPSLPIGGGFISPILFHLVGPKRAKEFSFMAGCQISGLEAAQWGLANRAVPADQLAGEVRRIASRMAMTPSGLLRMKKVAINRAMENAGFRVTVAIGAEVNSILHFSPQSRQFRDTIAEYGLREAIRNFETKVKEIEALEEVPS